MQTNGRGERFQYGDTVILCPSEESIQMGLFDRFAECIGKEFHIERFCPVYEHCYYRLKEIDGWLFDESVLRRPDAIDITMPPNLLFGGDSDDADVG